MIANGCKWLSRHALHVPANSRSTCILAFCCFSVWRLHKRRKQRIVPEFEDANAQASNIPDGSSSRLAMISARFDGGPVEKLMRRMQRILDARNYHVLIVEAGAGDDFGDATLEYLYQIKRENGVILAVCTWNYAEMTASQYSSHKELQFALENSIEVIPLRVEDTYPPKPPFGDHHPHDQHGLGQALVQMKIPPTLVFLECRGRTALQIASDIAGRLSSEKAGLRARHMRSPSHVRSRSSCQRGSWCGCLFLSKLCVTGPGQDAVLAIVGIEPAPITTGRSFKAFSQKLSPARNRSRFLRAPEHHCDVLH
ncbi:unnamed protein product [Symbiodinium sp. CCMP2592]|nr:unnamed protein product [Symbiodinium sp. CCMP2592]